MDHGAPLFILGAPRSGTSLLTRVVNAHPEIGVPYETQFYRDFYPVRARFGDLGVARNRLRLVGEMLTGSHMREFRPLPPVARVMHFFTRHDMHGALAALMQAWLETQDKARWGEKTPQHTMRWREIVGGFPEAKIIAMIRDGRDSTLSWRMAPFGPKHYIALARNWVRYIEAIEACRAALPPERFMLVRYETLLVHPEQAARDLCAFLGVEYDAAMLDFHQSVDRYVTDPLNIVNLARPVMQDNVEKWRTRMSPKDLTIFEAIAGEALSRVGYERALPDAYLGALEQAWMRWAAAPAAKMRQLAMSAEGRRGAFDRIGMSLRRFRGPRLRA